MSEIADDARVAIALADYASVDGSGKVNLLGAGWQVTGVQPETGLTGPQTAVVFIEIPARHVNDDFALTMTLVDASGQAVMVPGPAGDLQPLRIAKIMKTEEPSFVGWNVPRHAMPCRVQVLANFPGGLPLAANSAYAWQIDIDGDARPAWKVEFFVAGPPPGPVIG